MKKLIIFLLVSICNLLTYAQLLNVKIGSDALIEDVVEDAIVLVESKYCIQEVESGQKYGRKGEPYFNTIYSIGCITNNGIIVDSQILSPWKDDKAFDKYRDDPKYVPVLNDSITIIDIKQGQPVEAIELAKWKFSNDSTIAFSGSETLKEGLNLNSDSISNFNWVVWVAKSTDENKKDGSNLNFSAVKKNLELSDSGSVTVLTPNTDKQYLGGIYVTAKILKPGLMEFGLSGVAIKEQDKWKVYKTDESLFVSENIDNESANPVDELTPLSTKKSKKKNKNK